MDSNWNDVYQGLISSIVDIQNKTKTKIANDISKRLIKEGVPGNKIAVSSDKKSISASMTTDQEYQAGKIYFDKVMSDLDNDKKWIDRL